jgi:dihydrolipoamide dehydrogenase
LESSEHFYQAKNKYSKHGVMIGDIKLDLGAMMKRKDSVVRQNTQGVAYLFKKNKVEHVLGLGTFVGKEGENFVLESKSEAGSRKIAAPRVLIATGSVPTELPFLKFDGDKIISSTEALALAEVPKHLVVVGGGVIGLELGSVWARLGARVTVVEFMDTILPPVDRQISNELYKSLQKQGIEFRLGTKCLGARKEGAWMVVEVEEIKSGTKSQIECDKILVATGRKPTTQGLGLDKVGVTTNKLGQVEIDSHFQTNVPGIYAVGDVVAGPMLAHKGEEEGIAAVEIMAGQYGHVNYEAMPNVVYTWPEVATVGATEEEIKAKGIEYKVGTFPFSANGRARSMDETEGLVKVIADAKTDRVLGVHIVGARASDMLPEAVAVMEFGGAAEDIARTTHAHPTLSEIMKEAALAVDKRAIHM